MLDIFKFLAMKKDIPVVITMFLVCTAVIYFLKNGMDSLPHINGRELLGAVVVALAIVAILYFYVFKRHKTDRSKH